MKKAIVIGTREANEDFWTKSGVLEGHSKHSPCIVYTKTKANIRAVEELTNTKFELERARDYSDPESSWSKSSDSYAQKISQDAAAKIPILEQKIEDLKVQAGDTSTVPAVIFYYDVSKILEQKYHKDTLVVRPWVGQWRTDYFSFTVGELAKRSKQLR